MGNCVAGSLQVEGSKDLVKEKEKDKEIEHEIAVARNDDLKLKKLLLLGAGQAGKTTLYRQLTNMYGSKFNENQLYSFRPIIHSNVLTSIQKLLDIGAKMASYNPSYSLQESSQEDAKKILSTADDAELTAELANSIRTVWEDPGMQKAFEHASKFQILESTEYLMSKLSTLADPGYIPSFQDVLRSRAATSGIVETPFEVEGSRFVMIDVGGQRNERKKWIHCFEGVTSVIYIASLSCYDQKLFEDETVNAMHESLELFEKTINLDWFSKTDVILFLNKSDLFREKLAKTPITVYFDKYQGSSDFNECVEYIEQEFRSRVKDANKDLYCHVTCATDPSSVQFTFNAVKNIIIRKGLSESGIMT